MSPARVLREVPDGVVDVEQLVRRIALSHPLLVSRYQRFKERDSDDEAALEEAVRVLDERAEANEEFEHQIYLREQEEGLTDELERLFEKYEAERDAIEAEERKLDEAWDSTAPGVVGQPIERSADGPHVG